MMKQTELKEILEQHKLWVFSKGKEGKRANLSEANLSEANLSWADLTGADLSCVNLIYANLKRANLSKANLTRAYLREANLSEANLSWAVLTDVVLTDEQIKSMKNYETTNIWYQYNDKYFIMPLKYMLIINKLITEKDKTLAILYKNTELKPICIDVLKGHYDETN